MDYFSFSRLWFIPKSTYLSQYFNTIDNYYPNNGEMATVYVKSDNLSHHLNHLEDLISSLKNETTIVSRVDDWFAGYKYFTGKRQGIGKRKIKN